MSRAMRFAFLLAIDGLRLGSLGTYAKVIPSLSLAGLGMPVIEPGVLRTPLRVSLMWYEYETISKPTHLRRFHRDLFQAGRGP